MWMSGMSEVMKCDEKEEKYKREKRKRSMKEKEETNVKMIID